MVRKNVYLYKFRKNIPNIYNFFTVTILLKPQHELFFMKPYQLQSELKLILKTIEAFNYSEFKHNNIA